MRSQFRFSTGLAALYLILLILAVPWYWPTDETHLLFGLPLWVLTAIFIGFVTACLTAWILLRWPWPETHGKDDETHG